MVLEARENAEKIGFPVVGEKLKDASNIVDYSIRSEITKDASYEINANNQTTTGMATIIPGINAPQLLESTSIYSKYSGKSAGASASGDYSFYVTPATTPLSVYVRNFTLSNESGELRFGQGGQGLIVPKTGTYIVNLSIRSTSSIWKLDYLLYQNDEQLTEYVGQYSASATSAEYFVALTGGKQIYWIVKVHYNSSNYITSTFTLDFTIQSIS